jgi:hypothetical protein
MRIGLLVLPMLVACAGTETPVTPNNPPYVSFAFDEIGFAQGVSASLSVVAGDIDDGDAVTLKWSFSDGAWTPGNSANTAGEWAVPTVLGEVTVTVTASDGESSVSITDVLKVCTRASEPNARTSYKAVESPYLVVPNAVGGGIGDLTVVDGPGAVDVSIDPGVELLIGSSSTQILVRGTLHVNGTADNPVQIGPNVRGASCPGARGTWPGIKLLDNGNLQMTHTAVEFATDNILITGNASAALFKCVINCGDNAGINLDSAQGSLDVDSCQVTDHTKFGVIVSSETLLPTSVSITNTDIMFNGITGLHVSVPDGGAAVPMTFDHVLVYRNFGTGMRFEKSASPTIQDCHFEGNGNGLYNIVLASGFPDGALPDTIRATNCYWGNPFAFQSSIDLSIVDELDNATISTRVWVAPWRNTSPTGSPGN